jgi:hypothetical protein
MIAALHEIRRNSTKQFLQGQNVTYMAAIGRVTIKQPGRNFSKIDRPGPCKGGRMLA